MREICIITCTTTIQSINVSFPDYHKFRNVNFVRENDGDGGDADGKSLLCCEFWMKFASHRTEFMNGWCCTAPLIIFITYCTECGLLICVWKEVCWKLWIHGLHLHLNCLWCRWRYGEKVIVHPNWGQLSGEIIIIESDVNVVQTVN